MMKVAVVTALWYEDKFLPALFASLEATDYPLADWEIIMIDNKNSAAARQWIEANVRPKVEKTLPAFTLLPPGSDTGFAAGNNACIKLALERGNEAVYLLNEDAHGEPTFLRQAVERLAADPELGAVQSFLVLDPPSGGMNSIGNCLHFLGFSYCDGYKMPRHDAEGYVRVRTLKDPRLTIAAASGAAVLLAAAALRQVGSLDESYFMYHEDLDLSLRLREAGYALAIEPSSVVYHRYEFARSANKYYWMERNRYRLLLEHYKIWTLIVLLPGLLVAELGLIIFGIMGGTVGARFKAYGYILDPRNWAEIGAKRETVQAKRTVGDRALLSSAVTAITYQETRLPMMKVMNAAMAAYWAVARRLII